MSVNGGFGVMVQISEQTLQEAVESFVSTQARLFKVDINRTIPLSEYGIEHSLILATQLANPKISLLTPDAIDLVFTVGAIARYQTRMVAVPGGPTPTPPPELDVMLQGQIHVRVAGAFVVAADHKYMALDLRHLEIRSFAISVGSSNVQLPASATAVLSALARRSAVYALSKNVGRIPVSWTLGTDIPILGHLNLPIEFSYRVVAQGNERALALLLRVMNEPVDLDSVRYALDEPSDTGVFLELSLINYALGRLGQALEGYQIFPDSGGVKGDLIFHDAHLHVEPGSFVLDNIEVQSRTLQQVERLIEKLICTAIDPCDAYCESVFETVLEWVQLDQLANAHGRFSPYIDSGHFRVDASGISVNLAAPVALLVFLAADSLIPLGGVISVVLMVVGKVLADRAVENMIDEKDWQLIIDQPVPGTGLQARAIPRLVTWPDGAFAVMAELHLTPVS
ncbi:hypothetical protein [Dongia sp.]|uniref:hypothetical protein n=1 Tax=Dongia sp. TaxID=1977262 RepID=UPI0035B4CD00